MWTVKHVVNFLIGTGQRLIKEPFKHQRAVKLLTKTLATVTILTKRSIADPLFIYLFIYLLIYLFIYSYFIYIRQRSSAMHTLFIHKNKV